MSEVCAVIVARAGSKRIKNKSMLPLGNETLIARKIRQLRACKRIDRVVFGSDSDEMLSEAKAHGAEIVRRPDFYCDEERASANDMIANMCELIRTDVVVWAHCTNPLLSSSTYDDAVKTFFDNRGEFDSLLSVVNFQEHLWSCDRRPLNYDPYAPTHTPARNLPVYYFQDGGIFINPYEQMKHNRYFFGARPYLYSIPPEEFADINTMRDYLWCRFLIQFNENNLGGGWNHLRFCVCLFMALLFMSLYSRR